MIRVLYFAALRERLGLAEEQVALPEAVATVGQLRDHLAARGPRWELLRSVRNLRAAVNQTMVPFAAPVKSGDEVAFFPPVTGG